MLRLPVHATHPQPRLIARAVEAMRAGGLAIYPTDTTYGLGCDLFARRSLERIYRLKGIDARHPFSLLCADLAEVARYAVVENRAYRILRHHLPGKYTFVLPASRETPRAAQGSARTVGVRIPDHPVTAALLGALGHPIVTTTVSIAAERALPMGDPEEIVRHFGRSVEVFVDVGELAGSPSSVVDLTKEPPQVLRAGSGDLSWLS